MNQELNPALLEIRDRISDIAAEAMDVSHGIWQDADRICDEISADIHTRDEAEDLLAELEDRLAESIEECAA